MELNYDYLTYGFMEISDLQDFYKTNLPEIPKLRTLIGGCSRLFKVHSRNISVAISKTENSNKVYRLGIYSQDKTTVLGLIYYIPEEGRIDVYDSNPRIPLVCWKNKRCVWKNFSELLQRLGLEKIFQPLITGL